MLDSTLYRDTAAEDGADEQKIGRSAIHETGEGRSVLNYTIIKHSLLTKCQSGLGELCSEENTVRAIEGIAEYRLTSAKPCCIGG